uniref:Secreted protein n=1 Tax=Panagrellus redivivus TaxID=6233 RepID=A0A7E4W6F7_PANRE
MLSVHPRPPPVSSVVTWAVRLTFGSALPSAGPARPSPSPSADIGFMTIADTMPKQCPSARTEQSRELFAFVRPSSNGDAYCC